MMKFTKITTFFGLAKNAAVVASGGAGSTAVIPSSPEFTDGLKKKVYPILKIVADVKASGDQEQIDLWTEAHRKQQNKFYYELTNIGFCKKEPRVFGITDIQERTERAIKNSGYDRLRNYKLELKDQLEICAKVVAFLEYTFTPGPIMEYIGGLTPQFTDELKKQFYPIAKIVAEVKNSESSDIKGLWDRSYYYQWLSILLKLQGGFWSKQSTHMCQYRSFEEIARISDLKKRMQYYINVSGFDAKKIESFEQSKQIGICARVVAAYEHTFSKYVVKAYIESLKSQAQSSNFMNP